MAQHFSTVYNRTMKWHRIERREPYRPYEEYFERLPEGEMWLAPAKTDREMMRSYSSDELKGLVRRLYKDRLRSEYRVSYAHEIDDDEGEGEKSEGENELLEVGKRLYAEKSQKILKPMATSKKLFGYMRAANMYMGLSEYQDTIGRTGYDILEEEEASKRKR